MCVCVCVCVCARACACQNVCDFVRERDRQTGSEREIKTLREIMCTGLYVCVKSINDVTGHNSFLIVLTEIEKMNRRFDVEYCRKWVGHVLDTQEEVNYHNYCQQLWEL